VQLNLPFSIQPEADAYVIIDLKPLHLIDRTKNENYMIDDIISLPAVLRTAGRTSEYSQLN
jgi:hypothetical protein